MKVAGVDGCKAGWVAVVLERDAFSEVRCFPDFEQLASGLTDVDFIGIDVPIGLPKAGHRKADKCAQDRLRERRNTVFTVPPRGVLDAQTYEAAKALAAPGTMPSLQLWGIKVKILEVNDHKALDPRFFEVHPEVSFLEMSREKEPAPSKKSWNGLWRRLELLEASGMRIPRPLASPTGQVAADDMLDAAAAAWTALRKSRGTAGSLPTPPEDIGGRDVAIWY